MEGATAALEAVEGSFGAGGRSAAQLEGSIDAIGKGEEGSIDAMEGRKGEAASGGSKVGGGVVGRRSKAVAASGGSNWGRQWFDFNWGRGKVKRRGEGVVF